MQEWSEKTKLDDQLKEGQKSVYLFPYTAFLRDMSAGKKC